MQINEKSVKIDTASLKTLFQKAVFLVLLPACDPADMANQERNRGIS